ncbi:MAG: hypothetical protein ACRCYY_14695 [Trueperaceae bacterium]
MIPVPVPPFASFLLALAHVVAPHDDKIWLEDMRLEAPFVPNKLSFAFAALRLALGFRWRVLKSRPVTLAFASATFAALAAFLFVPRLFSTAPTTSATMTPVPYETVSETDKQLEQATQPQQGVLAERVTEPPEDAALSAVAEAPADIPVPAAPTPPAARAESEASATVEEAMPSAELPSADLLNEDLHSEELQSQELQRMSETSAVGSSPSTTLETSTKIETRRKIETPSAAPAFTTLAETTDVPPAPLAPSPDNAVLSSPVRESHVTLEALETTLLTLYNDSNFSGDPGLHRFVETGEVLRFDIPFSLYTENASAIRATTDGTSFTLSEKREPQFRIFAKP